MISAADVRVSEEYLTGKSRRRFKTIRENVVQEYVRALNSVKDKALLPYYPILYPTPFMLYKDMMVGNRPARRWFYNMQYPDARDFNKFAIYSTLNFLERYPNYVVGGLGHEIGHLLATKGIVSYTKDDLITSLMGSMAVMEKQESAGYRSYVHFSDDVRAIIKEWNALGARSDIGQFVVRGSPLVDHDTFDRMVFKERLPAWKEFIRSKTEAVTKAIIEERKQMTSSQVNQG